MKTCSICKSKNLSFYNYANHCGKLNWYKIKHLPFYLLTPLVKRGIFPSKKIVTASFFNPWREIVYCKQCGYGEYKSGLNEKNMKYYYSDNYWQSVNNKTNKKVNMQPNQIKRAKSQLSFIDDYLPQKKSLKSLEIGAAAAIPSTLIKKKDASNQCHVVEQGKKWNGFYKRQQTTQVASFFPFKSEEKYDLIFASRWLEHVINLKSCVQTMKELLNKGGTVFIEVPNCNEDYFNLDTRDIPHISFFTVNSLKRIFKSVGFDVVKIQTFGFSYKNTNKKIKNENQLNPNGDHIRAIFKSV